MFAFAIAERDTGRLTLVRDRLGIKPFYYAEPPGALRFASTLPALLAGGGIDTELDPVALHHYMHFHAVVPAPHTILRGVRKLPPATIRVVEPNGQFQEQTYWEPRFESRPEEENLTFEDWQDQVLAALRRAVDRRLVADVDVGVLLSGGLDSSLIVGLLTEQGQTGLNTFSVDFESVHDEAGDELQYSDIIARHYGTEHHKIRVDSGTKLLPNLPGCIQAMAEPMVSHDAIGFYLLSQEVAEHVKVVQSGQGADEVFAGYHWYPPMLGSQDPAIDYAKAFCDRSHQEYLRAVHPRLHGEDYSRAFVRAHFARAGAENAVDKALRIDQLIMLVDDPIKRVDNMTMAWGLEARMPFLDHELVEVTARIPHRHKLCDEEMVPPSPEFIWEKRVSKVLQFWIAEDEQDRTILGVVTGVDHVEAFCDSGCGSSLWAVAVDAQASYPGIGEALVQRVAEFYQTRGRAFLDLSVIHDNEQAIRLYEKLGFERVPVFALKNRNAYNKLLFTGEQPEEALNPYATIIVDEARRRGIGIVGCARPRHLPRRKRISATDPCGQPGTGTGTTQVSSSASGSVPTSRSNLADR